MYLNIQLSKGDGQKVVRLIASNLKTLPEGLTPSGLSFWRLADLRGESFCASCTLSRIFSLKVCTTLPIDKFLIVWYNISVIKRKENTLWNILIRHN